MISDARLPIAHVRGEAAPALGAEGVIEPQGFRHFRQAVPRNGPVGNIIVNLLRPHVVYVLRIVRAALRLAGADKLVGLENNIADAALAHPCILPALGMDPVHHHPRHRLHAVLPLTARLAFNQTRQQLPVGISHGAFLLCRWSSIRKTGTAGDKNPLPNLSGRGLRGKAASDACRAACSPAAPMNFRRTPGRPSLRSAHFRRIRSSAVPFASSSISLSSRRMSLISGSCTSSTRTPQTTPRTCSARGFI